MKHNSIVCIVVILFLSIILSGCISRNSTVDEYYAQNSDGSLNAVIVAPVKSYFGEEIEFDASQSYDINGKIMSYIWYFMDGKAIEGKTVEHTFEFDNDYTTKFPLIYTVSLFVTDDKGNIQPDIHHIMLYPKDYRFYFSAQDMNSIKPMSHSEKIGSKSLFDVDFTKKVSYNLPEPILIPASNWDLNLEIEKPFFSLITKISVSFFDENDTKIFGEEHKLILSPFCTNKNIFLTGLLEKYIDLNYITIELTGINLDAINLIYGSDEASGITFNPD